MVLCVCVVVYVCGVCVVVWVLVCVVGLDVCRGSWCVRLLCVCCVWCVACGVCTWCVYVAWVVCV